MPSPADDDVINVQPPTRKDAIGRLLWVLVLLGRPSRRVEPIYANTRSPRLMDPVNPLGRYGGVLGVEVRARRR